MSGNDVREIVARALHHAKAATAPDAETRSWVVEVQPIEALQYERADSILAALLSSGYRLAGPGEAVVPVEALCRFDRTMKQAADAVVVAVDAARIDVSDEGSLMLVKNEPYMSLRKAVLALPLPCANLRAGVGPYASQPAPQQAPDQGSGE